MVFAIPLKSICSYDVSRQMHKEGRAAAADCPAVAMVSLYGDQRCNISVKVLHSPPCAVCQGRGMLVVLVPVETGGVLDFGISVTIFLSHFLM